MKKKLYVHPQIAFEDIEEQDCILAGSPRPEDDPLPGIGTDVTKGDGDDDYAKKIDVFVFDDDFE